MNLIKLTVIASFFCSFLPITAAADLTQHNVDRTIAAEQHLQLAGFRRLTGTWRIAVTPEATSGLDPVVNFTSIGRDGQIVNVDPSVGTAVGNLRRTGFNAYHANFVGLINPATTYAVHGALSMTGPNTFSGTFDTTVSDLNGNILFAYSGTIDGVRALTN